VRSLDLVSLARRLGKREDEASLRAAASLAYYGAFHFAGERLEQLTADAPNRFHWSGRLKSHKGLRDQSADRWGYIGQTIANSLFRAHELRKKADYDLDLVFTTEDKITAFRFVAQALLAAYRVRQRA
jgi:hypothetical protein